MCEEGATGYLTLSGVKVYYVCKGNAWVAVPVSSGFSIRSSPLPRPGSLVEDLEFPIAEGDVIHLFDREKQAYTLHPYESGRWTAGTPMLSVGEAFWVAKTNTADWTQRLLPAGLETVLSCN